MNIADLKAGLDFYKNLGGREGFVKEFLVLEQAARTIALPILEADQGLRDRLAIAIWQADSTSHAVDRVLAAISTPTPVEES